MNSVLVTLWNALMDEMDADFSVSERVKQQFPKVNVKVVPLKFSTRGAAETLFIILRYMNGFELSKRTISWVGTQGKAGSRRPLKPQGSGGPCGSGSSPPRAPHRR